MSGYANVFDVTISNHCAPTAAVNLMKYWYNKDKTKYNSLKCGAWQKAFKKFYNYMGTNDGVNGTKNKNLASGYISFLRNVGISFDTVATTSYVSWSKMKNEIDAGYPFHLGIINSDEDNYYGSHSVVALGYVMYTYYNSRTYTYSKYLAIIDGWEKGIRYVHVSNSADYFIMVQVRLH